MTHNNEMVIKHMQYCRFFKFVHLNFVSNVGQRSSCSKRCGQKVLMRVALLIVGFLGLFGCKTKTVTSDKLSFDLKSVLDTVDLEEVVIGELHLPTGKIIAGDPFFIYDLV